MAEQKEDFTLALSLMRGTMFLAASRFLTRWTIRRDLLAVVSFGLAFVEVGAAFLSPSVARVVGP